MGDKVISAKPDQAWVGTAAFAALSILVVASTLGLSFVAGRLYAFQTGRMDLLAVAGNVLFIVALGFLLFRYVSRLPKRGNRRVGYLVVLLLGLSAFAVGYRSYSTAPPYTIESIAITVSMTNELGTAGHVEAHIQTHVVHDSLSSIGWGPLGSTGDIKNIEFVALGLNSKTDIQSVDGQEFAFLRFASSARRRQRLNLLLDFDVINSPPEDVVYWTHDVSFPTGNLQISIVVPSERPCKAVEAKSQGKTDTSTQLEPRPFLTDRRTRVTWAKANPDGGRIYTVICHW